MPVEFLTDEEAASYCRFNGPPTRAELERAFFLDDSDKVTNMIGTQTEDPPEIVDRIPDFAEPHREQCPEVPVPDKLGVCNTDSASRQRSPIWILMVALTAPRSS